MDFRLDYFFKESLKVSHFHRTWEMFLMYELYFILTVDFEIQHHHGQQIKSHQSASDPQRLKVPTSQTLSNERRLGWAEVGGLGLTEVCGTAVSRVWSRPRPRLFVRHRADTEPGQNMRTPSHIPPTINASYTLPLPCSTLQWNIIRSVCVLKYFFKC